MAGLDHQKVIRTWRLSLTCILLFLITWYYQVPESGWCLITIWFVMYEYSTVGGVFTKSMLRFFGTTLSAIYGMIVVYFCGNNPVINIMALVPGLFLYSYYFMGGDKTYIGTIGAVTLTIVLLNYNDIDAAILRVFNVIIGIIGSMFMMRFFYPQFARNNIIEMQINWLSQLTAQLQYFIDPSKTLAQIRQEYFIQESKILGSFKTYDRLVLEAKIETSKAEFFINHAIKLQDHFRRLFQFHSVFVNVISTDDLRTNAWVNDQLNSLIKELHIIRCRLLRQSNEQDEIECVIEQNAAEIEQGMKKSDQACAIEPPIVARTITLAEQGTEAILQRMHEEASLIDDEVKSMVLIYDIYDIKLSVG